jgi:hypothetical protein
MPIISPKNITDTDFETGSPTVAVEMDGSISIPGGMISNTWALD